MLYANDLVIFANTENELQPGIHKLNKICREYDITIPSQKTKTMAFIWKNPIWTKMVISGKIFM